MNNIPYADTHIRGPMIVIDVYFYDDTIERGVLAHSLELDTLEFIHSYNLKVYNLKVYKTQADVFKHTPVLYADVKKIEVVGITL